MNWLVIVVGITLKLVRRSCSCYTYNICETVMALFKFKGGIKIHLTTKLKSPPNKLFIQKCMDMALASPVTGEED